nr:hypothetical protein [Tanacetum cinerariifolium]
ATTPTEPTDVKRTEAEQLKIVLKRSGQETHISQQRGSGIDEGTGSRPGVLDVPPDDSEEELSWNSFDDEDGDDEATKSDRESEDEETREQEEESFDPFPQTPEDNEDDDNNEEDQGLRIGEEERMQEEEEADELYRDVDINQGRGLQVYQETEDSHMILTLTQSGMESIFTTGSTTVTPIPSPQSTMIPSIISTFTTASQLPTPPTQIPSLDLQSLPTFISVFRFEDRVKFLEDNFSNIPGIMEGNKSIQRSAKQRNLYKALVEAYGADKTILDTYGESAIL